MHLLLTQGGGLGGRVWLPELRQVSRAKGLGPLHLLGALPIQEEVAVEAALTFVPIAVVPAVHTHSLVFTRTLCHPVFNLAREEQDDHEKARTSPLLPQSQEFKTPAHHLLWIQRVLLWLPPGHFKLLLGDTDVAVASTEGVAGPAGPTPHGRTHEQREALLTVAALETGGTRQSEGLENHGMGGTRVGCHRF